jgi:hypothetical protein
MKFPGTTVLWLSAFSLILPALSQPMVFRRPTLGGVIRDDVINGFTSVARDYKAGVLYSVQAEQELAESRGEFWQAWANNRLTPELDKAYSQKLFAKDLLLLMAAVPGRIDGRETRIIEAFAGFRKFDGGVRPHAFPAFEVLVNGLLASLGARGRNDFVPLSPLKLPEALAANADRMLVYKRARDWAEFYRSGIALERLLTPEEYALGLIENRLAEETWEPGIVRPGTQVEAAELYALFKAHCGETHILQASQKVLKAPLNEFGNLLKPVEIKLPGQGVEAEIDPFRWLLALILQEPRAYALGLVRNPLAQVMPSWRSAAVSYRDLVARHGESRVIEAAQRVRQAPTNRAGLIVNQKGEASHQSAWFNRILTDSTMVLPNVRSQTYSVADTGALNALTEGTEIIARGTVMGVSKEPGGGALVFLLLHFNETTSVQARIVQPGAFVNQWGEGLAGLIGKTVQITCDFYRKPNGVTILRLMQPDQLRVISSETSQGATPATVVGALLSEKSFGSTLWHAFLRVCEGQRARGVDYGQTCLDLFRSLDVQSLAALECEYKGSRGSEVRYFLKAPLPDSVNRLSREHPLFLISAPVSSCPQKLPL